MPKAKPVVKHVRVLRKKAVAAVIPPPINLDDYEEIAVHEELHVEELVPAPALEQMPTFWQRVGGWLSGR